MSLQLPAQTPVLLMNRHMPIPATPRPHRFHASTHSVGRRVTFNYPMPTSCLAPVVGKPEKIECTKPTPVCYAFRRTPQWHLPPLLWMNTQPILGKALRYDQTKTINITHQLTADDKVIGKPDYETYKRQALFYFGVAQSGCWFRIRPDLSSSPITPVFACPGLRPRWCPIRLPSRV